MKYYTDIQEIFKEFEVQDVIPTTQQLKNAFNDRYKQPETDIKSEKEKIPQTVIFKKAFKQFIKDCGSQNSWGNATYEKFKAVKNHLSDFDKNLSFEALTESKLMDYVNYLHRSMDMRNTTIEKQISYLKWFLRWSTKKGYNNNRDFEEFKPKLKSTKKKVIFLTWKELNQLRDCTIPETKKYLERVRDVFLFSCFTGLRHSDVYNLRKSDIKENHIEITTIKTADSLI